MPRRTEEHPRHDMAVSAHDVTLGYAGREDRLTAPPAATESSTCSTPLTRPPEEPQCLS